MTLRLLLAGAEAQLRSGSHPERARLDAETLLLYLLGQSRTWLHTHQDDAIATEVEAAFNHRVRRRAAGEPIQYITGQSEFFGLPFHVGPGVLIPRPETEHLVEEVLRLAREIPADPLRIADIGTGSGIIAVALAHTLPHAHIAAVDLSALALQFALENAERNHVRNRIRFLDGDLLAPLANERFHIVASNPPYIPSADRDSLALEVREHEPSTALFAGEDGLAVYRRIIPAAREHLYSGGWLAMEIGFGQQASISQMLLSHDYVDVHFVEDYQHIPRVALARKNRSGD